MCGEQARIRDPGLQALVLQHQHQHPVDSTEGPVRMRASALCVNTLSDISKSEPLGSTAARSRTGHCKLGAKSGAAGEHGHSSLPLLFSPYKSCTASSDFLRKLSSPSSAGPGSAAGTSSHLLRLPLPDRTTEGAKVSVSCARDSAVRERQILSPHVKGNRKICFLCLKNTFPIIV